MHAPELRVGKFPAMAVAVLMLLADVADTQGQAESPPSPARALKPHDVFKDCVNCPEMVVVPAGEFMMGSPEDEQERLSYEGPRHPVKISSPFAVGRYAVTFDEWDACAATGRCEAPSLSRAYDEGWGRGRRPVINVSWNDAKAYVSWLSTKTGLNYRLLSEAEREYVTRAGTTTPFWWGRSISPDQAQYNSLSAYGGGKTRARIANKTLPVDSFAPNPWGLYQVHGNILEWVEDCWHENYVGAPSDGTAWVTGDCRFRVLRGGDWWLLAWHLRSAARFYSEPDCCAIAERDSDKAADGFRVARAL
jgi:formylglycine-generating enzyme required for sulfatase activity